MDNDIDTVFIYFQEIYNNLDKEIIWTVMTVIKNDDMWIDNVMDKLEELCNDNQNKKPEVQTQIDKTYTIEQFDKENNIDLKKKPSLMDKIRNRLAGSKKYIFKDDDYFPL